jgi:hypothetical protein
VNIGYILLFSPSASKCPYFHSRETLKDASSMILFYFFFFVVLFFLRAIIHNTINNRQSSNIDSFSCMKLERYTYILYYECGRDIMIYNNIILIRCV